MVTTGNLLVSAADFILSAEEDYIIYVDDLPTKEDDLFL